MFSDISSCSIVFVCMTTLHNDVSVCYFIGLNCVLYCVYATFLQARRDRRARMFLFPTLLGLT